MPTLHILKASGRLEKFVPCIQSAFKAGVNNITEKISLPPVDVVVEDNPNSAIDITGIGGGAPTAHLMYIHIDPLFENLSQTLDFEIRSTLAHELAHCARWHERGYGETLAEAIVSEGLADHFDIEINGGNPKPWNVALTAEILKEIKQKAEQVYYSTKYDHAKWFFGKGEIPRWAGYTIGFSVVGDYLQKTGLKASDLISEDSKKILSK